MNIKKIRMLKVQIILGVICLTIAMGSLAGRAQSEDDGDKRSGKRLFKRETFVGNGRTCTTCHSPETGTVSPEDARRRFEENPNDPLFLHDGSDDGHGNGVSRMLADATILVEVPLAENVSLANDPTAFSILMKFFSGSLPSEQSAAGVDSNAEPEVAMRVFEKSVNVLIR